MLEIWALEAYIETLEIELPSLIEKERNRLRQGLNAEDEQALHYTEIAEFQLDDGITTRLITGSTLIATWATFESGVQRAARNLEQPKDKFLDTSVKLFARLGIQHPKEIEDFYAIRNTLVHANGRVEDIGLDIPDEDQRQKKRLKIEQLANSRTGMKISHDGYLVVSIEFVRATFRFIEPLLMDLATRTDKELTRKTV
ncbi:MAG TPA: hypothetical protein VGO56_18415 [Pyrinomonadaceae bacterium]|nr:hypothetical protein [Pyrinomonadaceae bacterium]